MSELLGLEEAQSRLLALAPITRSINQDIKPSGLTRYLARDITASRTQPPADLSAMDGYAVTPGAGPWRLVGESRAGAPFDGTLDPGQCVRISTGAHVPQGSDRVLLQEDALVSGSAITATDLPPPGKHIRKAGFDFHAGDRVLAKGTALSPATLALAASAGHGALPCFDAPSVAVLDSGDELVPAGEPCGPHQIPASNGVMLGAMLYPYVGRVTALGPVPDDRDALAAALKRAEDSQILITSGGASVGDHDLIQQALKDWGADIAFWKVAIKPGKPLMVATREAAWGRQVILGLPGNPVSSFVTAFLFALPLVRASMGDASPLPRSQMMTAGEALPAVGRRREFLRAISDGQSVRLAGSQDSSALTALAGADCLIDRPANAPAVAQGEAVRVFPLRNG
ncbi:molybdopterin molybdotransferase MoeA [Erythrobacter sp. sf7]|uniref:Molybdopterin molybdenumtransferase n=1 Tax=Erythrobacter fulvus TaxID=2987523 RepID=A0ABT5JKW8_9SPHN|nr:molybdopterin molybdotransferase MoeA [Erythrobacter fulvus]MDC8753380.1 molybdopterin molybdotransferase MoeA [Erythrobacter fulvus]